MNINALKRDKTYIENHIGDIPISRLMRLYDKYANGSDMYLLGAEYNGKVYGKFYKHIPNRYITTQTGHKENNQYCRCRLHKWGAKELANAKGSFCIGTIEDIYKLHNNKGYCFEIAVYDFYNIDGWKQDNKRADKGGDIEINGVKIQMKYSHNDSAATITSTSKLLNIITEKIKEIEN